MISHNFLLQDILARFHNPITWTFWVIAIIVLIFRDRPIRNALSIFFGLITCVGIIFFVLTFLFPYQDVTTSCFCAVLAYLSFVLRHLQTFFLHTLLFISMLISSCLLKSFDLHEFILVAVLPLVLSIVVYFIVFAVNHLYLASNQKYYSTAYTSSGFSVSDLYILLCVLLLTILYAII